MENQQENPLIKMVKKDAIVDVKIGAGMLQLIHQSIMLLTKDRTPEDLEKFKKEMEAFNSSPLEVSFSEDWMSIIMTLSLLVKEIETKAVEQNLTTEIPLEDLIKSFEQNAKKEENQ